MQDLTRHHSLAFGFAWNSDVALPAFSADPGNSGRPALEIVRREVVPQHREPIRAQGNVVQYAEGLRYHADREATFDLYTPGRVEVTPGPDWTGTLPPSFFGTLTAFLLAGRGCIPLHGSAVEIEGRAVLICGPAGAGKSTLAAGLIALGARLISDDLSILHPVIPGQQPMLFAGRRAIRLFSSTAEWLAESATLVGEATPARGKLAVLPTQVDPLTPVPLSSVVVLGSEDHRSTGPERQLLLKKQLYRPHWMRLLPGRDLRLLALSFAARQLAVYRQPSITGRQRETFLAQAERTWRKVTSPVAIDIQ